LCRKSDIAENPPTIPNHKDKYKITSGTRPSAVPAAFLSTKNMAKAAKFAPIKKQTVGGTSKKVDP